MLSPIPLIFIPFSNISAYRGLGNAMIFVENAKLTPSDIQRLMLLISEIGLPEKNGRYGYDLKLTHDALQNE